MSADFLAFWSRLHPGRPPIGFRMREAKAPHWVHFDLTPSGDRTQAALLERANSLAGHVLGDGAPCWVVQAFWDNFSAAQDFGLGAPLIDSSVATHTLDLPCVARHDEADGGWLIHAGRTDWRKGGFDPLLAAIALDDAEPTLWVSTRDGAVFAPCHDGVDVFMPSADDAARIRAAHPEWLSNRPAGG